MQSVRAGEKNRKYLSYSVRCLVVVAVVVVVSSLNRLVILACYCQIEKMSIILCGYKSRCDITIFCCISIDYNNFSGMTRKH